MTKEELIDLVNYDLKNELKHLHFYLQAGVMVAGLHRAELKEFLLEEAASELEHCKQFAELVVHLGGVPETVPNEFPTDLSCPMAILRYVVEMESEVAVLYANRLKQTDAINAPYAAYAHVFYEDQIADSQKTAWEVEQMIKQHEHK